MLLDDYFGHIGILAFAWAWHLVRECDDDGDPVVWWFEFAYPLLLFTSLIGSSARGCPLLEEGYTFGHCMHSFCAPHSIVQLAESDLGEEFDGCKDGSHIVAQPMQELFVDAWVKILLARLMLSMRARLSRNCLLSGRSFLLQSRLP